MQNTASTRALELALHTWRRHMLRFFCLELPSAVLVLLAAPRAAQFALPTVTSLRAVATALGVVLVAYVWMRRMPPERPSAHDKGVIELALRLSAEQSDATVSPSGTAA